MATEVASAPVTPPPSHEAGRKYGRAAWLETPRLLFFHELPFWQQDNEHILSGYRPTSGSAWTSFTSLLYVNNQTVNTYSHLFGALIFLLLPFHFHHDIFPWQPNARKEDVLVVSIYCTTSTALCCTVFTLTPAFVTPEYRKIRASFYAGFGLSSIIFVVHGLILHGWELQKSRMSLVWMGWMATANLVGALIYAARIPERWVPYTFDNFGASHQILHVAVMIAAWIHFRGLMEAFHTIRSQNDICRGV
ncbi:Adiponectin receptor protein [Beauveria bassiana]|uniref:Adiponectin receptor protein n=1 Tax=Beauveria bassiana TaxID=176275 RepID=A0A2N6P2Y5_BEABA|nr:Adiponectin receptor protein [Beauveria bassiana]